MKNDIFAFTCHHSSKSSKSSSDINYELKILVEFFDTPFDIYCNYTAKKILALIAPCSTYIHIPKYVSRDNVRHLWHYTEGFFFLSSTTIDSK